MLRHLTKNIIITIITEKRNKNNLTEKLSHWSSIEGIDIMSESTIIMSKRMAFLSK